MLLRAPGGALGRRHGSSDRPSIAGQYRAPFGAASSTCNAAAARQPSQQRRRQRHGTAAAVAATAELGGGSGSGSAEAAASDRQPPTKVKAARKGSKAAAEEEQRGTLTTPELPTAADYQQTLLRSFTLGGVGLHTGEYAWVRVRPAHAGEGRYFVRVPEGTNKHRFKYDAGSLTDEVAIEEAMQEQEANQEVEDLKVEWFELFLTAQEERGFAGSFRDFLRLQVDLGELDLPTLDALLGGPDDERSTAQGVEPELSREPEEVVPLDPSDPSVLMACVTSVRTLDAPCTQLGEGDTRVLRPELLLAALEGCGIDNARIEIEGGHEIPVLDNSALGWCIEIQVAGARPAPLRMSGDVPADELPVVMRDIIAPSEPIAVRDDDGWVAFFPGPSSMITSGVDHSLVAPVIGTQWWTWHVGALHFRYCLAPARGYVESIDQLFALREAGWVQGAAENVFLIANGDKWHDPSLVRMVYDEPARARLVELAGNLALMNVAGCQGLPLGHVTCFNASPALQLRFVRAVLESIKQGDVITTAQALQRQAAYFAARAAGSVVGDRVGTSRGAPGDMPGVDGSPAVVEAEVMDDEEDEDEAAA